MENISRQKQEELKESLKYIREEQENIRQEIANNAKEVTDKKQSWREQTKE